MRTIYILLVVFVLVTTIPAMGDQLLSDDLSRIITKQSPATTLIPGNSSSLASGSTNELTFIASNMIRVYQRFISSQDVPSCQFVPSCSRFGALALNRHGLFQGSLMASDRILRCHPRSLQYYEFDEKTGHFIDNVETYALW